VRVAVGAGLLVQLVQQCVKGSGVLDALLLVGGELVGQVTP
jgi:hypothetical protein